MHTVPVPSWLNEVWEFDTELSGFGPVIAYNVPAGGMMLLTRYDDNDCADTFQILSADAEAVQYAVVALELRAFGEPVFASAGDGWPLADWLSIGGGHFLGRPRRPGLVGPRPGRQALPQPAASHVGSGRGTLDSRRARGKVVS